VKRAEFLSYGGAALIAAHTPRHSLEAKVHAIARTLPGRIGVYARTMAPGPALVTYRAGQRFPTASTIKLLILATAYVTEERRPGTLEQTMVFRRGDLIGGSDFMSGVSNGKRFTIAELIVPMIRVSDNTASNMLIEYFGIPAINAVGARAGMRHTRLARHFLDYAAIAHDNRNVSTPADMGRLLYLIESGAREGTPTIVSARHCRRMVAIMLGQTDRDGIPAALPPGVAVANKTGAIDGTRNDVAIVEPFGDSPFILSIMTADAYDYAASYAAIHAVTRATYGTASRTFA
jgi:beta-lactamase class A